MIKIKTLSLIRNQFYYTIQTKKFFLRKKERIFEGTVIKPPLETNFSSKMFPLPPPSKKSSVYPRCLLEKMNRIILERSTRFKSYLPNSFLFKRLSICLPAFPPNCRYRYAPSPHSPHKATNLTRRIG